MATSNNLNLLPGFPEENKLKLTIMSSVLGLFLFGLLIGAVIGGRS